MAYNQSLTTVFYLGAAAAAVSVVTSFGLGWTNLKTKKKEGEMGKEEMNRGEKEKGGIVV